MVILKDVSEASSSCSPSNDKKYDVFLSFRGADTRNTFTSHLHKALKDANLKTFFDDEEIDTGLSLKPELESAIRASRASVIVLSENYATSRWCLNELALILEQHRDFDHIVIPIFYHVEPTDVRKQQKSFGDAMEDYKKKMAEETDADKKCEWAQKIEMWKNALTLVADLKGKEPKGAETVFIEEIVKEIYHRLGVPLNTTLPLLIGMDYDIEFITSWLKDGSSHTGDILTILGMGGIGKTSLAKYVYGLYRHKFSRSSIVKDISRRCGENFNGLLELQKQLCGNISNTSSIQSQDVISVIENALANKKVLLVLDDVDSFVQLDALLGKRGFYPGSKIIITTKDESLTHTFSPLNLEIQPKHTKHFLVGLDKYLSLKLLSIHAFRCAVPKKGYEEVSDNIVKYSQGHPLALEVLGRSLQNQDVAYWEDYINMLKKEPRSDIEKVLEVSFHSLPDNDKELFKYIACFFVGKERDFTEIVLKACGINTSSGITNLIQRCLVSINSKNELKMHSLMQNMGRELVRQESPNKPWKRSRLWDHDESLNVLKRRKGTEDILGLYLDMRMLNDPTLRGSFELQTDTLSNLDNLKLLQLSYMHINGSFENFPQELRLLCMHGFPSECIPSDLRMQNLVALDMSCSNIKSFDLHDSSPQPLEKSQKRLNGSCSKDKRSLGSLKILDLSFCEQLLRLGGFSEFPSLERLIVTNCIRLVKVCESIEQCAELSLINLSYCNNLEKLPTSLGRLKKVKTLLLDRRGLHERPPRMRGMDSQEMIKVINSQKFSSEAISSKLFFLAFLPSSLVRLSLVNNNLSNKSFPTDFSRLSMLKELNLNGNPIKSMPACIRSLPRLEELCMSYNKRLVSVEHPPRTLKALYIEEDGRKAHDSESRLHKILLDPEMSPLELKGHFVSRIPWSVEIQGMFKAQTMSGAVNILHSLGWIDLANTSVSLYHQVYYEFGIFSTLYEEEAMPNWIGDRNKGPIISFTIPNSSPKKLRGLNFCTLQTCQFYYFEVPSIKISNVTKNITWIYNHLIRTTNISQKFVTFLSHWMFGTNEMEAGDEITITVTQRRQDGLQVTVKCGIGILYDDEEVFLSEYKSWNERKMKEKEVLLSEYKSWNERKMKEEVLLSEYKSMKSWYERKMKEKEVFLSEYYKSWNERKMKEEVLLSEYESWNERRMKEEEVLLSEYKSWNERRMKEEEEVLLSEYKSWNERRMKEEEEVLLSEYKSWNERKMKEEVLLSEYKSMMSWYERKMKEKEVFLSEYYKSWNERKMKEEVLLSEYESWNERKMKEEEVLLSEYKSWNERRMKEEEEVLLSEYKSWNERRMKEEEEVLLSEYKSWNERKMKEEVLLSEYKSMKSWYERKMKEKEVFLSEYYKSWDERRMEEEEVLLSEYESWNERKMKEEEVLLSEYERKMKEEVLLSEYKSMKSWYERKMKEKEVSLSEYYKSWDERTMEEEEVLLSEYESWNERKMKEEEVLLSEYKSMKSWYERKMKEEEVLLSEYESWDERKMKEEVLLSEYKSMKSWYERKMKEKEVFLSEYYKSWNERKMKEEVLLSEYESWNERKMKEEEVLLSEYKSWNERRMKEEEEEVLSYYKSWNNIIGKDLSAFQSPTGEYILQNKRLSWDCISYFNRVVYSVPDEKNSIG